MTRRMNKIEQMFYDSILDVIGDDESELCNEFEIIPQNIIGIYKVDFVVRRNADNSNPPQPIPHREKNFVIEIDGYEYHKTKEQREHDYKRERYLLNMGYTVIRFTGTEIFLSCRECALEAIRMIDQIVMYEDIDEHESCTHFHKFMNELEGSREQRPRVSVL